MQALEVFNTLSRKKELFEPINPPFVGMYLCGPTVYGDAHLGHARPVVTFDVIYRYLTHIGYKVRYVRNITDVGHLENDADEGEDKIAKKARVEKLEPMEVAQYYSDRYHENMAQLNTLKPSIRPRATGHIIEQIEMIKKIVDNGYGYIANGSVYFDVLKYHQNKKDYGKLSGRIIDDLIANTRELDGQDEKNNSVDFALWKKAHPEHIMRWPSPWGDGFPGWHIECSAMSAKYLGETFDIHGGGMDLLFPHHECEIAQSQAANHSDPVKYWLHNNMITINGQKMGKSLGNFITLDELFSGNHKILEQGYSPMTVKFFILQAHYRSTLDFSSDALKAAEKGFKRMVASYALIDKIKPSTSSSVNVVGIIQKCYESLNDDFNTAMVIANLFEAAKIINSSFVGNEELTGNDLLELKKLFDDFAFGILGLQLEISNSNNRLLDEVIGILIEMRADAKNNKDYATSDRIRNELLKHRVLLKDTKEGTTWSYEEELV